MPSYPYHTDSLCTSRHFLGDICLEQEDVLDSLQAHRSSLMCFHWAQAVMQECKMIFEELLGLRSMCWRLARTWLDCYHHPGEYA